MIRLSVTDLDGYLYWKKSEDMEFEDLLVRLRGEEPQTEAMGRGKAFHSMFENAANEGLLTSEIVDGYRFEFDLDASIDLPAIRELKGEIVIPTASGPVTLVGKIDSMYGVTVNDYKLMERFDAERYTDSYQWRCYLMMFGCSRFLYDVFVYRESRDKLVVYDYHRLPMYAYPAMEADVNRLVSEVAAIVAKHVPQKMVA